MGGRNLSHSILPDAAKSENASVGRLGGFHVNLFYEQNQAWGRTKTIAALELLDDFGRLRHNGRQLARTHQAESFK